MLQRSLYRRHQALYSIRQYFSFQDVCHDFLTMLRLQYYAITSHGGASSPKQAMPNAIDESLSFDEKLPRCRMVDGRYISPWTRESDKKSHVIMKWLVARLMNESPEISFLEELDKNISLKAMANPYRMNPVPVPVNIEALMHPERSQFTWMGHSSCYYQTNGLNIMTDPVWSNRCSPFQWLGPLRAFAPPIDVKRLAIDVVLISHTHYDHLDAQTADLIGNRALW
jgi:hypothetical protein